MESRKEGLWVIYRLTGGVESLYAGHMQAILRNWLNDDRDIQDIVQKAATMDRCEISGRCR